MATSGGLRLRLSQPWVASLLVVYVGWGSTFPAMRVALRYLPPFFLLSARCLLAGVVLLCFVRARRAKMPSAREWTGALAIGGLTLGLGHGLTTWGVVSVPGGTAAILVSMAAIWIAVLSWIILRERPGRRALVGLVAGFAGLVVVTGWATAGVYPVLAVAALLVAPICWALGSVLSRKVTLPVDTLVSTAAQLLVTAPLAAVAGLLSGELRVLDTSAALSSPAVLSFAYLTLVGYVLVFTVYTWLLREAPMTTVGTYAYVNPLVAVVLGVFLLGEPLTVATVFGGAVILLGVALVVLDAARYPHPGLVGTDGQMAPSRLSVPAPLDVIRLPEAAPQRSASRHREPSQIRNAADG